MGTRMPVGLPDPEPGRILTTVVLALVRCLCLISGVCQASYVIPMRLWREGSYERRGAITDAAGSGAPVYGIGSFELA